MTELSSTDDNAFWRFSVAVYGAPGVAAECLSLQDRLEIDVNVLLFCGWVGWSRNVQLISQDILSIADAVHSWHGSVVKPLRAVRKKLKGSLEYGIPDLREAIKSAELGAEKVEQDLLFTYAQEHWPVATETKTPSLKTAQSNLLTFCRLYGAGSDEGAQIDCIVTAISALPSQFAL